MIQVADNESMFGILLILGIALLGLLSIRYGVDSRPDEHPRHRSNL